VPERPGRVVTLVTDEAYRTIDPDAADAHETGAVFGALYRVKEADWPAVIGYLDVREKGGYTSGKCVMLIGMATELMQKPSTYTLMGLK
jgi:cation transport regulator ChaC